LRDYLGFPLASWHGIQTLSLWYYPIQPWWFPSEGYWIASVD